MNTKAVYALLAVVVVIAVGFLFLNPSTTSAPAVNNVPQLPAPTTTAPTGQKVSAPLPITVTSNFVRFDPSSLTATSTYPTITGTANVSTVDLTVYTHEGVGIVSTAGIPVKDGRWSYSCSVALVPGEYVVVLFNGQATQTARLTVNKP